MEMNIDDVLNDSKEYGQVDDNVNDALKAILAGQKAIMDKVTELERKQMLLESNIVSDSRHIGVLDNESQNPNVLDGHSKVTIELPDSSANISTREKLVILVKLLTTMMIILAMMTIWMTNILSCTQITLIKLAKALEGRLLMLLTRVWKHSISMTLMFQQPCLSLNINLNVLTKKSI